MQVAQDFKSFYEENLPKFKVQVAQDFLTIAEDHDVLVWQSFRLILATAGRHIGTSYCQFILLLKSNQFCPVL